MKNKKTKPKKVFSLSTLNTSFLRVLATTQYVNDSSLEELLNNREMVSLIAEHWFQFACSFSELQTFILDIQYAPVSPTDKACMILKSLVETTTPVTTKQFIANIEKILHVQNKQVKSRNNFDDLEGIPRKLLLCL